MALSACDDPSHEPTDAELAAVLGRAKDRWDDLVDHLSEVHAPLTATWQHSGPKYGWTLRLIRKKRTILYMTPVARHILVGFILGEKAAAAAQTAGLSEAILKIIDEAPRYGEGRGCRIEVRYKRDCREIETLAAVKMGS